jgi:hypothetical protein
MFRDNVPVVELSTWNLEATLFDGDLAAGPVPVLFTEDPDSSRTALANNVAKAHYDTQKIASCFYMPEILKLEDALTVVRKPRYYNLTHNINLIGVLL